jgi:hypothetical protein
VRAKIEACSSNESDFCHDRLSRQNAGAARTWIARTVGKIDIAPYISYLRQKYGALYHL